VEVGLQTSHTTTITCTATVICMMITIMEVEPEKYIYNCKVDIINIKTIVNSQTRVIKIITLFLMRMIMIKCQKKMKKDKLVREIKGIVNTKMMKKNMIISSLELMMTYKGI